MFFCYIKAIHVLIKKKNLKKICSSLLERIINLEHKVLKIKQFF
ncbi:conserved hypothetical protein (plasmid) [Borreliella burgdorferi WI91-23]|nr:conserved hypothetical protein [Borreliella burgdorferi WI91-23]